MGRLLRVLMPRVENVRAVMPRNLDETTASELRKAVEDFGTNLRMQKFSIGAPHGDHELPYLVYASQAEVFRATVAELGLVLYAATVPHLLSTKGLLPDVPGVDMGPWAIGNAVFLRFERGRGGQQVV